MKCLEAKEFLSIQAINGGRDSGAVGYYGVKESMVALEISLKLIELLQEKGAIVFASRESDEYVSINNRILLSNQYNLDAFISIHANAAISRQAEGSEVWHADKSINGIRLAKSIQDAIIKNTSLPDRGIKSDATNTRFKNGIPVLRRTRPPAVIVEPNFISNKLGESTFIIDGFQDIYAYAIMEGLESYFK